MTIFHYLLEKVLAIEAKGIRASFAERNPCDGTSRRCLAKRTSVNTNMFRTRILNQTYLELGRSYSAIRT